MPDNLYMHMFRQFLFAVYTIVCQRYASVLDCPVKIRLTQHCPWIHCKVPVNVEPPSIDSVESETVDDYHCIVLMS